MELKVFVVYTAPDFEEVMHLFNQLFQIDSESKWIYQRFVNTYGNLVKFEGERIMIHSLMKFSWVNDPFWRVSNLMLLNSVEHFQWFPSESYIVLGLVPFIMTPVGFLIFEHPWNKGVVFRGVGFTPTVVPSFGPIFLQKITACKWKKQRSPHINPHNKWFGNLGILWKFLFKTKLIVVPSIFNNTNW